MKSGLPSVNLLRYQRKDFLTQFLDWALTVGRLLVILTETVALVIFIYRFSIDRQLSDLRDYVRQRTPYLQLQQPYEDQYRDVQARLAISALHENDGDTSKQVLQDIVDKAKGLIVFKTLRFNGKAVQIDATSPSIANMKVFIDKLTAYDKMASITINQVQQSVTTSSLSFSIAGTLK